MNKVNLNNRKRKNRSPRRSNLNRKCDARSRRRFTAEPRDSNNSSRERRNPHPKRSGRARTQRSSPPERGPDPVRQDPRAFQVRFRLTEQQQSALKSEQILLEYVADQGRSLPSSTPILDTMRELACSYIRPDCVVGAVPRYARNVQQIILPGAEQKESLMRLDHMGVQRGGDDLLHAALAPNNPNSHVLFTTFEVSKWKVAEYLRAGHKVSALYIKPGTHFGGEVIIAEKRRRKGHIQVSLRNRGSFKMSRPFFLDRCTYVPPLNIVVEDDNVFAQDKLYISSTVEQLSDSVSIFTFYFDIEKGINLNPEFTLTSQSTIKPEKLVDAQRRLNKAFDDNFEIRGSSFHGGDVRIPFDLLVKLQVFSLQKTVDKSYSVAVNKYIGRMIRADSSLSDEEKWVLLEYVSQLYTYLISYRGRLGARAISDRLFRGAWNRTKISWAAKMEEISWNPMLFILKAIGLVIITLATLVMVGILGSLIVFVCFMVFSPYKVILGAGSAILAFFLFNTLVSRMSVYGAWHEFKIAVEEDRLCINVTGPIPEYATILDFETLIDPEDYPLHASAKIQIKDPEERLERKPAVKPVGIVFNCKAPIVHSTSQHNAFVAITSRALVDMPKGNAESWDLLDQFVDPIQISDQGGYPDYDGVEVSFAGKDFKPHGRVTYKEYYDRFDIGKKMKMDRCMDKIESGDVSEKQFCFETFIKREKIMGISKHEFEPLRPRVIQGCSQAIKCVAGPWYLNYSYALKNAWNPLNNIWYCSGYSGDMYDSWFDHWTSVFGGIANCWFIGTDFSKYDVTQGEYCMQREYNWYKHLGLTKLQYGEWALGVKKHYRGYARGIKYSRDFTRKSGEPDTSAGNTKNTGESVSAYWNSIGMKYAMAVLGDDNFTIVFIHDWFQRKEIPFWRQKAEVHRLMEGLERFISGLGYKLKIQHSHVPEKVEFLSSRFYRTSEGFHLGKKPGSVISKLSYFLYKPHLKFDDYLGYLKGAVISLKPVCNHVPFLRVYCERLLELTVHVNAIKPEEIEHHMYRLGQIHELDSETWDGFYEVYGLGSEDEEIFAKKLKKVTVLPFLLESLSLEHMVQVDDEM